MEVDKGRGFKLLEVSFGMVDLGVEWIAVKGQ